MNHKDHIKQNKLRDARKALGLHQQDVANILGLCSTDRISHWELGKAEPSILNLFRLSNIYSVPPEELYPELYEAVSDEITEAQLKLLFDKKGDGKKKNK